jgi:hypothetical protein
MKRDPFWPVGCNKTDLKLVKRAPRDAKAEAQVPAK